jgi:hypothetical protein
MNLALLGTNTDVLRLAAAAHASGHKIVWVGDVQAADRNALARLAPDAGDPSAEWELLLDRSIADAVVIGCGTATTELRAEQLKRLAAEAVPMLVVHPVCDSVLPYYEVDMARRESLGLVRHYNPMDGHPIQPELRRWVVEGHHKIGTIHQVTCERRLDDCSQHAVISHLARDLELLAAAAGDIRRVTAIGPRTADDSYASLQIQMRADGPASLRWSVRSAPGATSGLEMTFVGERGSAALYVNGDSSTVAQWELETNSQEHQDRRPLERYDPAGIAIRGLAEAVADSDTLRRSARSTWEAATRAMEVADAVELSLERGRTIDVFQQQLTERLAFRGTMAALGCGLLMVGFVAIMLVTILGGVERQGRAPLVPGWPVVLLAMLSFFLFLQVVPLLVQRSRASTSKAPRPRDTNKTIDSSV